MRPIRSKSSSCRSTCASRAIASRCSTAFVEPATAITTAMAFSNASLVMMSRGREAAFEDELGGPIPLSRANDLAPVVDRGRAALPGKRHPDRLADGRHRVGGVHPGARTRRGAGGALEPEQFGIVDRALGVRPHGLEDVLDRDVRALVGARKDRAAVQVHGVQVHAGHRHQHAGLGLVTARDARPTRRTAPRASPARPNRRSGRGSSGAPSSLRGPSRCRRRPRSW